MFWRLRKMTCLVSKQPSWCCNRHPKVMIKTQTSMWRTVMMLAWYLLLILHQMNNHLLDLGFIKIYNLVPNFAIKFIMKIKMVDMFRCQKCLLCSSHQNQRICSCRSRNQWNYFPRGKWPNLIFKSPRMSHAKPSFRELTISRPSLNKADIRLRNLHLQTPKMPASFAQKYLNLLVSSAVTPARLTQVWASATSLK